MTLDEAKQRLNACVRESLVDHAFGDAEVYWMDGEEEVADGYFGLDAREVTIGDARFVDDEATALRCCGKTGRVERNDSQGASLDLEDLTDRELVEAGLDPVRFHEDDRRDDFDPGDEA